MKNSILKIKNEEEINNFENKNIKKVKEKSKNKLKKVILILLILMLLGISVFSFLLYGPWSGFRDWLITTAMTTMNHQYFATIFYNDDEIKECLGRNKVVDTYDITDTSKIEISEKVEEPIKIVYENEYERQVLEKDPEHEDYKIFEVEGDGYSGYMAVIYDPSKIKTVYTKKLGVCGQYLSTMAKDNDAVIAINGGGFYDPNYNSNGANPLGITISDGEIITSDSYSGSGGLIGFTEDDKLVLGKMSVEQAKAMKIRDAVTFGPFLIVNGKSSEVLGNGGWGKAPRTVIAQRKDGIVLFLVLDGRTASRPGADMNDLIEIMEKYGAYNAANLDGGTSSVIIENGKMLNDPIDSTGAHKTRFISTGFILTK